MEDKIFDDKFFDIELINELNGIDKNLYDTMIAVNAFLKTFTLRTYAGIALLDTNGIISRELWEKKKKALLDHLSKSNIHIILDKQIDRLVLSGLHNQANTIRENERKLDRLIYDIIKTEYEERRGRK